MKLPRLDMVPKTPEAMTAMILESGRLSAYQRVTTEARRKRLTENDIAVIERDILAELGTGSAFAHEFKTFEVEPAVAQGKALLKQLFENCRAVRAQSIGQG